MHADRPLPAFLRYALDRTGLEAMVLPQFLGLQKASNVRKVVDLADDFSRTQPAKLTAFVQYLDQIAGQEEVREGDAALHSEGSGSVTLMTIHKSKGLEFPIVVVPDLSRARRGPDAQVVAVHPTLGMAACPTDDRGERAKPAIHQAIHAAAQEKDAAEHARVLYVAMTRARDWLLLGGSPKPAKSSWLAEFDRLYGVSTRRHGESFSGSDWAATIYRNAPPCTLAEAPRSAGTAAWDALAERVGRVASEGRGTRVFSVSELLDALDGTPEAGEAGAGRGGPHDPLLRGTLVHRLFERWPLGTDPVDIEALIQSFLPRACPALDVRKPMASYLRTTAERFAQSEVLGMMKAGGRVERETPFLLRAGDALISGTVDVIFEDGTLIDYKTGRRDEQKAARYERQLQLYAAAVWGLLGRQPPSALIYYADTGEHVAVDVSADRLSETLAKAAEAIDALDRAAG
jgi:ATP-dependent helicase/nuclease subunit A